MQNKKIKNTTLCSADGIDFKSKLELNTYNALIYNEIIPLYEEVKFELIPSFTFLGEKIRPMTYTPDFTFTVNNTMHVIECKGFANDAFPLKWKLIKWKFHNESMRTKINYKLHLIKNKADIENLANFLSDEIKMV